MRQILLAFSRHRDDRSLDQYLELDASSLVQVQAGLPPATALGQPDASATLPPPGDALPRRFPRNWTYTSPRRLSLLSSWTPGLRPCSLRQFLQYLRSLWQRWVLPHASPLPPPPPPPVDNTSFACRDLLFRRHRGHWQILVEWEPEPYCATWQPASDLPDVPLESVPLLPEGEDGLTCATCDLPHARHPRLASSSSVRAPRARVAPRPSRQASETCPAWPVDLPGCGA
ncbi:hypothetical protein RI054_45g154360 [Pseudoscourfieldia marina]